MPPRTNIGLSTDSFPFSHRTATAYQFLEFCHSLGTAGAESALGPLDRAYIAKVRRRVEEVGCSARRATIALRLSA